MSESMWVYGGVTVKVDWKASGYLSPCLISCLFLPSNDTQAVFRASGDSMIYADKTEIK